MRHESLNMLNVSLTYGGEKHVSALSNVTLRVMEGEFVAILGPSGCGKSSLLHLIAGFLRPSSGTCLFLVSQFRNHRKTEESCFNIVLFSLGGPRLVTSFMPCAAEVLVEMKLMLNQRIG